MSFKKVEIVNVGYMDETGREGILEFKSEDDLLFTMNSFGGEVSYHIKRFIDGDRSSIPTIYNMIEELAENLGVSLNKSEIYERSDVLRANLYFVGKDKQIKLENYRASDAIALSIFYSVPIYIESSLFN